MRWHPRRAPGDQVRGARAAAPGGVRACFGAFGAGVAGGLELCHDHGSQFVADDYQRELAFLGIASSPAFVREPEGNGFVERFNGTVLEEFFRPTMTHLRHRGWERPGLSVAYREQGRP
jgi:transposase InsO family protein